MRFFVSAPFLILFLILARPSYSQAPTGKIIVNVGYFEELKGTVKVILFDTTAKQVSTWNINQAIRKKEVLVDSVYMSIVLDSIPAGRYAIEVVHDKNSNGKFEYRYEDYTFSNDARVRYRPVRFSKAAFYFNGTELKLPLYLENDQGPKYTSHYSNSTSYAPVISYAPETSLLLGANVVKLFKFKHDSLTRTSYADAFAAVTLNKQFVLEQNYTMFSNREKYILTGFTGIQYFPQYYFGVGNTIPQSNKEQVKYTQFRFEHLALRKIYRKLFAGIGYRYVNVFNVSSSPTGVMETSQVAGYRGSVVSGVQFAIASDNRNNVYNTTKGHLVRLRVLLNSSKVGSSYNFNLYEADLRKFIRIRGGKRILALQAYGYFTEGNVPWSEMGALGSDVIMRGYYSGRYRDKNYIAAQAEYRVPLNKVSGFVFFAGFGEVAHTLNAFTVQGLKPDAGLGYRFTVDRRERLNIRLDYGIGRNTTNFYFTIAEAF